MWIRIKSTTVFKWSYDPFGSGANQHLKESLLQGFINTRTHTCRQFVKYASRIGKAQSEPWQTEQDRKILLDAQAYKDRLEKKGGLPKSQRWMSWPEECPKQLEILPSLRMVLEDHFGTDDPEALLRGDVRVTPAEADESAGERESGRAGERETRERLKRRPGERPDLEFGASPRSGIGFMK